MWPTPPPAGTPSTQLPSEPFGPPFLRVEQRRTFVAFVVWHLTVTVPSPTRPHCRGLVERPVVDQASTVTATRCE